MIRLATREDFGTPPCDESGIRIHGLVLAYGLDVSFIRYYSDGVGGLLSVMDGVGVFSSAEPLTEEWATFITMNPDIRRLHCSADVGQALTEMAPWTGQTGVVLRYEGEACSPSSNVCREPSLPAVYALLDTCFRPLPPLDAWYPDVSHRVRHGCCRLACILEEQAVVSTAMTVAETKQAAILGQVATSADHRRKGYASQCVCDLISQCEGKQLYILPVNKTAEKLYISLGFAPCGQWAELERL